MVKTQANPFYEGYFLYKMKDKNSLGLAFNLF
jgi:hypothetical protein